MSRQLRDTFALDLQEARQDGLLIQGVAVLGRVSKNGRTYSDRAMNAVAEAADGMRVFADHPDNGRDPVRPVASLIGRLRRVRVVGEKVKADLQVVDAPPWRDLLPALREDSMGVGLSIRARGTVQKRDGRTVVEDVSRLQGVELVSEPATTSGLRESLDRGPRRVTEVDDEVVWQAFERLF